jgi:hypothetical protein
VRVLDRQSLGGLSEPLAEGVLESTFEGYEPVIGDQPTRR